MADPTFRSFAGLEFPLDLLPRIITAFRATYPQQTTGLSDEEAMQAALLDHVTSTWSAYESRMAAEAVREEIRIKEDGLGDVAAHAFEKAQKDAKRIMKARLDADVS